MVDQRRAAGQNVSAPSDELRSLRPSLKQKRKTKPHSSSSSSSSAAAAAAATATARTKQSCATDEVKCVFEVTAESLQDVVIESPVPVLLDVYADWCGPCKQLTPMLERAAAASRGGFRLAKLNSDVSPSIAQALGVTALPAVFALSGGGKVTDRFLGMRPQHELQTFITRCVTGSGPRIQNDMDDKSRAEISFKLASAAGLASITFKKKEVIAVLAEQILDQPDAYHQRSTGAVAGGLSEGLSIARMYVENAALDIANPVFRRISARARSYALKVAGCQSALMLLKAAGFRPVNSSREEEETWLELTHSNAALLRLLLQVSVQYLQRHSSPC
jgi:thioredoxin-like negative regulator of GroEL